jgi:polysaccharide deacetylase family protein (PEP-CTERM system associated)
VINYLSFDIEDWFQVENLKSAVSSSDWEKQELRVEGNTEKILEILSESGTKATFFILGWIARKNPALVKKIASAGHEIASHGYAHTMVTGQSPEEFRKDIVLSQEILEDLAQKKVIGYRAPSFSITPASAWALDILKDCGFLYDSSVFPTSLHDRYGFKGMDSSVSKYPNGLVEVPISTFPLFGLRLPLGGGGYFRLFPYAYFKYAFRALNRRGKSLVFYLHPWELDPGQPRIKLPAFLGFRHYTNLKKTESRLRRLLRDFKFQPIGSMFK